MHFLTKVRILSGEQHLFIDYFMAALSIYKLFGYPNHFLVLKHIHFGEAMMFGKSKKKKKSISQ